MLYEETLKWHILKIHELHQRHVTVMLRLQIALIILIAKDYPTIGHVIRCTPVLGNKANAHYFLSTSLRHHIYIIPAEL